jgi:hypothetical protein
MFDEDVKKELELGLKGLITLKKERENPDSIRLR